MPVPSRRPCFVSVVLFFGNPVSAEDGVKVSIIIPVINEAATISISISRAWESGCDELIVVDGGSDDGTVDLVRSKNCELIEGTAGRGSQLNLGANIATGDTLLFLHADNWLEKDACDQLRQSIGIVNQPWGGFHQAINNPARIYRWLEKGNAIRTRFQSLVYGDQAMFVTRKAFDQVGGFPDIPLMEDFEISRRLYKISFPLLLAGRVHVGARRWESNGVINQTLRNWSVSAAYRFGASPESLSKRYRRHDS